MGLDSFKTEGPRTYKRGGKRDPDGYQRETPPSEHRVHILKGSEPDLDFLPMKFEVHEVVTREQLNILSIPSGPPYFVCPRCGSVASSFEAKAKADYAKYNVEDWAERYVKEAIRASENVDVEEIEFTLDFEETPSSSRRDTDEDDEDDDEATGLDAFAS